MLWNISIKKIPALEKLRLNLCWAQTEWQNSRYENIHQIFTYKMVMWCMVWKIGSFILEVFRRHGGVMQTMKVTQQHNTQHEGGEYSNIPYGNFRWVLPTMFFVSSLLYIQWANSLMTGEIQNKFKNIKLFSYIHPELAQLYPNAHCL